MRAPADCPACSAPMQVFHEVTGVPVTSCQLVEDAARARALPRGDLRLGFCDACGFIANTAFRADLVPYDEDYEETQGFSSHFQAFVDQLARRWVDRYDLHDKRILEVGSGKGEFLLRLAELGPNDCLGVDPVAVPDSRRPRPRAGEVTLLAERYRLEHSSPPPDAVVCRHTLEHVPDVLDFLRLLRAGAPEGAVLLFELPDTARVLEEGAFEDVYYEHCSYFTAGSLSRLFRRCGFTVLDVRLAYDDQYLLLEARPGPVDLALDEQDRADIARTRRAVEHFRRACAETASRWRGVLEDAGAARHEVVLWGGGSKAVAFLTALGVGDRVRAVVDINPYKQGKAMPGTGHPVVSPESLRSQPPDLVVVMNPAYVDEVRTTLDSLGLHPELLALNR